MSPSSRDPLWKRIWDNVLLRTFLYYVVLIAAVMIAWRVMPDSLHNSLGKAVTELTGGGGQGRAGASKGSDILNAPSASAEGELATSAALAITAAFFIALPVAWIYTLTRAKKGYRQALAHALIVLPVVDAGVVVLVKNSLALAFSLAGIVAAVRFRNTLEDSKDAVYILVAAAIGLACGTQVPVALVLSIGFNVVTVILWMTDFGRNPASLEGSLGYDRLTRTREQVSHTTSFIAVVDDELLKDMSPAQLDALADRAWRRRRKINPELDEPERPMRDQLLRIYTSDPGSVRALVEPVLKQYLRQWQFGDVIHESPTEHVVEYSLHLGRHTQAADLLGAVQLTLEEVATRVELL
jgi:hypothetical protein